jgi:imidazolonepropionase-like amidohydrolase
MLVLPGSAGNIGGQAFTFKPRWTAANTPGSMQVDPPFTIHKDRNGTQHWERTGAWRHIKHACGENPMGVYGNNRMDSAYDFRRAYTEGKKLKEEQDRWCADPKSQKEPFPTSLEWEVLADVIRGNVKVNIHCYETTDLNSMVRISNEFEFPIAAFHHAHETYLVPDLIKQAWGSTPGVALFATNARYKREALRGSEYAPAILAREGIRVSMKSDHPVLDSRYLVYEAAQAHHYGLNTSHAIASVTSHSAEQVGLGHRLGYIRAGYDADVVVWDSFPLSLGATPKQVYIDGIAQIESPFVTEKPEEAQRVTEAGDWEEGAREAIATRGEPDLTPKKATHNVVFTNVNELYRDTLRGEPSTLAELMPGSVVVVREGLVVCAGECVEAQEGDFERIDLKGGSLTRGMITVGSHVGNIEIAQEKTTWDGVSSLPFSKGHRHREGSTVTDR